MNKPIAAAGYLLLAVGFVFGAQGQNSASQAGAGPQISAKVPVMDGGAGPCALEMTVLDGDGKPVYDATVKVHIAYGFAGVRKLDLQAGTNSDGKLKFAGLPSRVHRPPLEFLASKGQREASLSYDPSAECDAEHTVTLEQPKGGEGQ